MSGNEKRIGSMDERSHRRIHVSGDPGRDIAIAKASLRSLADAPPPRWGRAATIGSLAGSFAAGFVLVRFPAARAVLRAGLVQAIRRLSRSRGARASAGRAR
jgi:hypothetical protein